MRMRSGLSRDETLTKISEVSVVVISRVSLLVTTLENHCTRTAQSSRGGCSRRAHKIIHLAVKKGNILFNVLLLKRFIANLLSYKSSCASA